jgi:hypothetical protein
VWALSRLLPAQDMQALARTPRPAEDDPEVATEWRQALQASGAMAEADR